MLGNKKRRVLVTVVAVVFAILLFLYKLLITPDHTSGVIAGKLQEGYGTLQTSGSKFIGEGSYEAYLNEYKDVPKATTETVIQAKDYKLVSQNMQLFKGFEGSKESVLLTEDTGFVEWEFTVPESAMYQMNMKYYTYGGNGSKIERKLYIDGEIPYKEAQYIEFDRLWSDGIAEFEKDLNGNDIRPNQLEVKRWQSADIHDGSGYYESPLMFYLKEGVHTLRLEAVKEPLMIENITLYQKNETKTYEDVKKTYADSSYQEATGDVIYIQGEHMFEKTEKSNFPNSDRSSSFTMPQKVYSIPLNSMGGTRWQNAGSKVSWNLSVPETGLYKIALRYRQSAFSGMNVTRKLTINGELPFEEAGNIRFPYDTEWKCDAIGDGNEDYLFYFEAGREYTLGMEVVLGDTAGILRRVEETVTRLNGIYRSILMITGATPDKYRDYDFDKIIPDVLSDMLVQADELKAIIEELETLTGEKGERIAQLTKMEYLVRRIATEPSELAGKFTNFKDNIAALGAWVIETTKQPLEIDYFALIPGNKELPKAEGNWVEKSIFGFKTFLASFVIDYSEMGMTKESAGEKDEITVWMATGRDQQNTLRSLINSDFTKKTGITVNLELVNPGTLLPSVLAGTGPDVALSNGLGDPINFALRNAVMDLSDFEGFDEIMKRFSDSAIIPYQYNGATYALPETQSFSMLFYRKDIFDELGLKVPATWEDLDNIIGELQKKNMSIGLPHDLNMLLTFMYQNNAELYVDNGERTNLDAKEAVLAFTKLTEYYTLYKLPIEYDFVNRFRSGEMPLAIADYTVYNQLSLFAPEIRGNWEMVSVPGTRLDDGSMKYAIPSTGTGVMMMKDTKNPESAWEFMDWWTSTQTQAAFCIEMESVINASAKQPTANMDALRMLPWTSKDMENIMSQWVNVKGTPEVPGGYYTSRVVTFAFNKVYNDKEDPADVLQTYMESLNAELARKSAEFNTIK